MEIKMEEYLEYYKNWTVKNQNNELNCDLYWKNSEGKNTIKLNDTLTNNSSLEMEKGYLECVVLHENFTKKKARIYIEERNLQDELLDFLVDEKGNIKDFVTNRWDIQAINYKKKIYYVEFADR